jgi:hypothetical protein
VTRERWIALAVGTITVIITLLLLAVLETSSAPAPLQPETLSRYEPHLIELDKRALDQAYTTQAAHVFGIWIKDGVGDASRAKVGFANARKGYDAAMTAIAVREQRLPREQP